MSEYVSNDEVKNGIVDRYACAGWLIERTEYVDNMMNGKSCIFDQDGNLRRSGYYQNDRPIGDWAHFSAPAAGFRRF